MPAGSPEVRRVDADGVVRVERAGRHRWGFPLGAAVFGAVAIAWAWMAGAPEPEPSPEPVRLESAPRAPWPVRARLPVPVAPIPVAAAPEPPPGIPTGIALFPAPGTDPLKRGIIVPEGLDLPPGYVRHYQSTDDGQALPAILMFHPDFQPVDAQGQPVPIPKDRVVPPQLAPPGMPVQILEPPDQSAEGGAAP